jgi:predicted solute-binding protein
LSCRIGSVPYLNARPLVYGIEDRVTFCPPARLAELMYQGQFDAGLVPVAEVLAHDQYDLLDGIAIASRGAVRSVFLVHREPVECIQRIAVDQASRTSVMLLRVLLKVGFHVEPEFYPRPRGAKLSDHEAMMLIGDDALWYRARNPDSTAGLIDLGEMWQELTGLPFVFAAWAFQRGSGAPPMFDLLRQTKANGLANLDEIVQQSAEGTPEFRREYLTRNVCFDLGDAQKAGLRRFQQYAKELGIIERCHDLRYVG